MLSLSKLFFTHAKINSVNMFLIDFYKSPYHRWIKNEPALKKSISYFFALIPLKKIKGNSKLNIH